MKNFNFDDFDAKSLSLRLRNYNYTFKIFTVVLLIFFAKFVIVYGYKNYIALFAFMYLSILSSFSIVKKLTQNYFLSILSFFFTTLMTLMVMIFMSGGIRAPGNIWLSIFPFAGAHLLGKRGFTFGVIVITLSLALLLLLNYFGIEMYPFKSSESFQFEFRVNLIIFTISTFYFTYTHVMSEADFIDEINEVKERNENLLRILFHDLANPMQTIQMLIKKYNSHRSPEDNERVFQQIEKTSLRIVEILEHVRKMKAIEDKKIVIQLKPVQIFETLSKVKEMFEERLLEKNISFNIQNEKTDDTSVHVDSMYFTHQVLSNVVSNAIKFTPSNGFINCSWVKNENFVIISITDSGIGMPKEILKNLFNQNKQISRKGTMGETGTGYGMPLVKTFIEEFGGTLNIESNENKGTIVQINLPLYVS